MSNLKFDAEGFYAALDGHRQSKGLTWKKVADQAKISASTLTRMGQGKRPDVDTLAGLASWSGIDAKMFYRTENEPQQRPEPLSEISALLRADKNLGGESAIALETMLKSAYEHMRKK
ncbi:MAG: helix-turn-helix transcriptional regulator [Rhodospirillaceae bacterium]|jgi:transcriptional regulator with XRE-family HTH domain|nr:helix-turn-helix transcriptional regulator [Rhodospirillaceae bacterium]MBT4687628.1 helix-turn-helix transcriptional regulator [Rhodospirillaceae bacterium]MBT5082012.1 helix-turn-helix transcriptional regulator [Rhodospirillaceae bacterium]MBT5524780.1 helix-turn-helix transcriptional regulator [Rhodospirillaceae bacterium]MBT5881179.1 helix-turn-helix transcriptional regulator [Rhodospirillaceae bacterium]